jgi:hypothetical protein
MFFAQAIVAVFLLVFLYDMIIMRRPIRWWTNMWVSFFGGAFVVLSYGFIY